MSPYLELPTCPLGWVLPRLLAQIEAELASEKMSASD
jgi:hypothetical protein